MATLQERLDEFKKAFESGRSSTVQRAARGNRKDASRDGRALLQALTELEIRESAKRTTSKVRLSIQNKS